MNQKELIKSIGQLKDIKPRKEWVVLLKSQILTEQKPALVPARKIGIAEIFSWVFTQRKMAYSLATLAFIIVGLIGFAQYTVPGDLLFPVKKISEQSQAALSGQTMLKQDITALNNRINELAQVAKEGRTDNIPSAISEISANVSALAKNLKENSTNDPKTLKEIAVSLKTLANVPGTDLTENKDVKDLYQVVVEGQIADLEKTTLTEEQKEALTEIKELYSQEKYTDALEKILLINN